MPIYSIGPKLLSINYEYYVSFLPFVLGALKNHLTLSETILLSTHTICLD